MPRVLGIDVDPQTRCRHWHSPLDVIAIKMQCCGEYYACKDCHDALAHHPIAVWPRALWNQPAILCGICSTELTIEAYLESGYECPACKAPFNPGCGKHYAFYFDGAGGFLLGAGGL